MRDRPECELPACYAGLHCRPHSEDRVTETGETERCELWAGGVRRGAVTSQSQSETEIRDAETSLVSHHHRHTAQLSECRTGVSESAAFCVRCCHYKRGTETGDNSGQ